MYTVLSRLTKSLCPSKRVQIPIMERAGDFRVVIEMMSSVLTTIDLNPHGGGEPALGP